MTDIPVKFNRPQDSNTYTAISDIKLETSHVVCDTGGSRKLGKLEERLAKILCRLNAERNVEFQLYFQIKDDHTNHGKRAAKVQARYAGPPALLQVIIYGPFHYYNSIGDFLAECSLYLQDPYRCDRNVPYCNPHLLTCSDEERLTTFQLNTTQGSRQIEESGAQVDPFDLLRSEKAFSETEPPPSIITTLYRYETFHHRLSLKGAALFFQSMSPRLPDTCN